MKIINWISGVLDLHHESHSSIFSWEIVAVNPDNGLPMIGGIGGLDTLGNPYGMDDTYHERVMYTFNDYLS